MDFYSLKYGTSDILGVYRFRPETLTEHKVTISLDSPNCFLTYCNAHTDLKAGFCGGSSCTTTVQADKCKRHWDTLGRTEGRSTPPYNCYKWTDGDNKRFKLSQSTFATDKLLRKSSGNKHVEVLYDTTQSPIRNIIGIKYKNKVYGNERGYDTCR